MPGDFDMFNPTLVHQKCVHHTRNIRFIGRRVVFQILHLPNDGKLTAEVCQNSGANDSLLKI